MPGNRPPKNLKMRYIGDRSEELNRFLKAINKNAYHVLTDLHDHVLPHFLASRGDQLKQLLAKHSSVKNLTRIDPEFFWTWQTDLDTWNASWEWAAKINLTKGMNPNFIRSKEFLSVAASHYADPVFRRRHLLTLDPSNSNSPESTFGIPLLEVVWFTLATWAEKKPSKDALSWTVRTKVPSKQQQLTMNRFQKWMLSSMSKEFPANLPKALFYNFITVPWDPRDGTTRAQAYKELLAELKIQLNNHLDNTIREQTTSEMEESPQCRSKEHFDWLAHYQVLGLSFSDVGKKFGEFGEDEYIHDPNTKKKSLSPAAIKREVAAKTNGIKSAAELLIGPQFLTWLRESPRGRPKSFVS